ncbi:phosphoglucosamine mutase [candidate division WOR-3 bacterium]|nr:phosphoglucosamine mutase [candidate division WOR-3 bacterium]
MPLMFSVSGLRGIVGKDLTPEIIASYAQAFGRFIGSGTVLVGRDTRRSSPEFLKAVKLGLGQTPCTMVDLGIVPTPTVLFMVRMLRSRAGIVITASHNPAQWNALKFIMAGGRFLNKKELEKFKDRIGRTKKTPELLRPKPVRKKTDAIRRHIDRILKTIRVRAPGLVVAVDAVNGAGSKALPQLIRSMGCRVFEVNCAYSPRFPRGPEPVPENLYQLSHLVRVKRCDLGVACDPDCDRVSFVDEKGEPIGEDMSVVLAADYVLGTIRGPVVANLSTTRLLDHVCEKHDCALFRTPVGEAHVVEKMQKVKAVFGGEGNGGIIDPRINLTRDALVGTAFALALLVQRKVPLSTIIASYPSHHMVKVKIRMSGDRFLKKAGRVRAMLKGRVTTRDGLLVKGRDFWVHVRPSQTEPLVRIIGESSDAERIKDIVHKIQRILS